MTRTASTTVQTQVEADIAKVFSQTVPVDLSRIFKRYLLVPAVVETDPPAGTVWDKAGLERQVLLDDGNTARETLTKVESPNFFSYRVFDASNFIGKLAEYATGEWHFEARGSSTLVVWTYAFTAKNVVARLPLLLIVKTFFRGYMKRALRLLTDHIEETNP